MPDVVGVRFKPCGKIYDFEVNGLEVSRGDLVVVDSELGINLGNIVIERHTVDDSDKKFKKIIELYRDDIVRKWVDYFVYNIEIVPEKITRKI